jgi:hypothetical protein
MKEKTAKLNQILKVKSNSQSLIKFSKLNQILRDFEQLLSFRIPHTGNSKHYPDMEKIY